MYHLATPGCYCITWWEKLRSAQSGCSVFAADIRLNKKWFINCFHLFCQLFLLSDNWSRQEKGRELLPEGERNQSNKYNWPKNCILLSMKLKSSTSTVQNPLQKGTIWNFLHITLVFVYVGRSLFGPQKKWVSVNGLKKLSKCYVLVSFWFTIDVSNFRKLIDWEGQSFELTVQFPRKTIQLITE